MRNTIRHPTDIPIHCTFQQHYYCMRNALLDVSASGMKFVTDHSIPPGELIHINIYIQKPKFEASCRVVWCNKVDDSYHVGVCFERPADVFHFRMVEQICHIEHYRRKVKKKEGRVLSSEEAAYEWIELYAHRFSD